MFRPAPSPSTARGLAIVCVDFDDETASLTANAVAFARRADVDLRFVHVVEIVPFDAYVVDGGPFYGIAPAVVQETLDAQRTEKQAALSVLLGSLPADVNATGDVLTGDAVTVAIADAETHGASMMIVAANLANHARSTPAAFTFALQLMKRATLPVLVTGRTLPLDFKDQTTLLFADDLQPATEEAARKTFDLAAALGCCRVRHLHVHGDFREALKRSWTQLKAKHPALFSDIRAPEELDRADHDARVVAMRGRGSWARKRAEQCGARIEDEIAVGPVLNCLNDSIRDAQPTIVVFGRHRSLKSEPFLLGRVGHRAMLTAGRAVLVVPPHDELYGPVPFPRRT